MQASPSPFFAIRPDISVARDLSSPALASHFIFLLGLSSDVHGLLVKDVDPLIPVDPGAEASDQCSKIADVRGFQYSPVKHSF